MYICVYVCMFVSIYIHCAMGLTVRSKTFKVYKGKMDLSRLKSCGCMIWQLNTPNNTVQDNPSVCRNEM